MSRSPAYFRHGFTLIEMMVALVIFAIFIGAVYGTYQSANQASASVEERADVYQTARVLLAQVNHELCCAYQSGSATTSSLLGEDTEGDATALQHDTLTLLTTGHRALNTGEPAGDVCQVKYSVELDADEQPTGFFLTENLHPGLEADDTAPEPTALSDMVAGMNCKYLDGASNEWQDEWVDREALPAAVRVELVLKPRREGAKPIMLFTTADLAMYGEKGAAPDGAGPSPTPATGDAGTGQLEISPTGGGTGRGRSVRGGAHAKK
ncbi:MAG: prepilin-type N-terminal cleavage/methylation domain-containing protein [Armatimonadota bacterium]